MILRHRVLVFLSMAGAMAASRFAGTWEGTVNGLPAVQLVLRDDHGQVGGSIGFYLQTRGDGGKWKAGEKTTLPLLSPKLENKVLTFETIHHKRHGSPELGPNNRYRVEFISGHEARLQILNDGSQPDGTGLKLKRR